ncbi:MAG: hypothetical protein ACFFD4_19455 [Candidatus Odinarchaeota archaeon]
MVEVKNVLFIASLTLLLLSQWVVINEINTHVRFGEQYGASVEEQLLLDYPQRGSYENMDYFIVPDLIIGTTYYTIFHNNSEDFAFDHYDFESDAYFVRVDFNNDFSEITGIIYHAFPYDNTSWLGTGLGSNGSHFFTVGINYIAPRETRLQLYCFTEDMSHFSNRSFPDDTPLIFAGFFGRLQDSFVLNDDLWLIQHYAPENDPSVLFTNLTRVDLDTLEITEIIRLPTTYNRNRDLTGWIIGNLMNVHVENGRVWMAVSDNIPGTTIITNTNWRFYNYSLEDHAFTATIHGYDSMRAWESSNHQFHGFCGASVAGQKIIEPLFKLGTTGSNPPLVGFNIWSYTRLPALNVPVVTWIIGTCLSVIGIVIFLPEKVKIRLRSFKQELPSNRDEMKQ